MHTLVLAGVVTALSGQPAAPATIKPVVLVMTNRHASGVGFVDSLRIQLNNSGVVRAGPVLSRGGLAIKLQRARNLATQHLAQLVVWIERDRRGRKSEYVLYVVNPNKGASNVEMFRIRARAGPDVDRTLALKVSDVLDRVIAGKATPTSVWVMEPPPLYQAPPLRRWTAGVLGRVTLNNGSPSAQATFAIDGGRQIDWQNVAVNFGGGVATDFGVSHTDASGQVTTRELVPSVFVAVLRRLGALSLGLRAEPRLRLVRASGRTSLNNRGDRVVVIPTIAGAMDVRLRLSAKLQLRLAVGAEIATRRRKFAVNGVELVDLGRFRGEFQLGLSLFLP